MHVQSNLEIKIKEFNIAIEKYNRIALYGRIENCASIIMIILQITTAITLFQQYQSTGFFEISITIFLAYFATDFINGLAHMIADNSSNYEFITRPYIAAFKLHHIKPMYQKRNLLKTYFYETGHKLWLVFYLVILFIVQHAVHLNICLNLGLVIIGVLSSIAELSHFWCHNVKEDNALIRLLQKYHILLSMKHHRIHHRNDNVNYAFLNGMSDPLLNLIARYFYKGYKNRSDKHVTLNEPELHITSSTIQAPFYPISIK